MWNCYKVWKVWKLLVPRNKNGLLLSGMFCLSLLILMFTSFKWQNSIYLSAPKLVSLLLLWNAYIFLLMYLHTPVKQKEPAALDRADELPSNSAFFSGLDIPQREVFHQEEPVLNSKSLKIMKKPSFDSTGSKPKFEGKVRRHITSTDEKRQDSPAAKAKVQSLNNNQDDSFDFSQL